MSVLLIGAGPMAVDYAKVLTGLGITPTVAGRSQASAEAFTAKTGLPVTREPLETILGTATITAAIVAVTVNQLAPVTLSLLSGGVKRILVEKPAGLDATEITTLDEAATAAGAEVFIAYNRRFYGSVIAAREIIAADGGVQSFAFEFTELGHRIAVSAQPDVVKANWFYANSTHVVDLAFHLGGTPVSLTSRVAGSLPWHPAASRFVGCGATDQGSLFSYHANWVGPGRWGLEMITARNRLIFRPMEKLQIQPFDSFAVSEHPFDETLDKSYKPGLYRQTAAFLGQPVSGADTGWLCGLGEHAVIARNAYAVMLTTAA